MTPDDENAKPAEKPHADVVTRPAYDPHISVVEPNDVVDLYQRYTNVTGHDVEWERATSDVDAESGSVKTALTEFGEDHPDGIGLGRLIVALADSGAAIGETLDAIHDLRMNGEVYEPQDNYILVV